MITPCWPVLIIVRGNTIPEGLLPLPIPLNWVLRDMEDALTHLMLLVACEIPPLLSAGNIGHRHGQRINLVASYIAAPTDLVGIAERGREIQRP
jgi:hypothetical protein